MRRRGGGDKYDLQPELRDSYKTNASQDTSQDANHARMI